LTLRSRLALTVLVAAVPLVAALAWLRADLARRDADRSLVEFAVARMESGGRERCEADPSFFAVIVPPPRRPGELEGAGPAVAPPPPSPEGFRPPVPTDGGAPIDAPRRAPPTPITQMWAYGPDMKSANPRAPEMPADLAAEISRGAADAGRPYEENGLAGRELVVRMSWTSGPCAFVLVRRIEPASRESAAFPVWSAVALVVAMLGVVALAAGPVVRRIRKLTDDVKRSARDHYATSVDVSGGDEIAELARAFNDAGGELRGHLTEIAKREQALRDFVANTTHDVMTPITVLAGQLTAIRTAAAGGRAVEPTLVNAAIEEAHYLASLVHNLGAAAKLDAASQEVRLSPVNLNEVVDRVVARHWPVASPRAVDVEFAVPETPIWIDADVTLLEQAVSNVVGNAVRYNRPGGHVAVILDAPSPGEFSLRVVDDGTGVPDEQLARLTEREFRSDEARRRHPEGMGLGLDIARRVAAFHRISLAFRRSQYGGLEVEFKGVRGIPPA
jgi:signal transduction histidine kinase